VIYIVMAACGAAEQARVDGSGSSSTSGGGSFVDGALETIADVWAEATDPVRDARASPADFEVSTVACSKTFTDTIGRTILYAEQEYPGASAAELSHVTALVDI